MSSPSGVAGLILVGLFVAVGVLGTTLVKGPVFEFGFPPVGRPSRAHPLGTDASGRDMLFLITRGIRTTLTVVAVVGAVSLTIGAVLGLAAGYLGGLVDALVTRTAEFLQSVPRFFLILTVIAVYGPGIDKIIILLSLTSWTFLARTLRAETLSVKSRPYVDAAVAAGARTGRILVRHILPHVMPRALVVVMLLGSRVILIEAGLAFLGLGDRGKPSLGMLASESQDYLRHAWWLSAAPGIVLVIAVLGLNLLADGISRALEVESQTGRPQRLAGSGFARLRRGAAPGLVPAPGG